MINTRFAFAAVSFAVGALGCATKPLTLPSPAGRGEQRQGPNLQIRVRETVVRPELDGLSYAKIYLDGALAGQTPTLPRSQEKSWEGRVEPGNHPLRVELWVLPGLGAWQALRQDQQPRERFVKVEPGQRTDVDLTHDADTGASDFQVSREPL